MCGFAGFLGGDAYSSEVVLELLENMGMPMKLRGPDDQGNWYDPGAQVGLVHRRLSIIDVSSNGHQPMHSISGRYVLVFNGEIYNHNNLRSEIEVRTKSIKWRGHSDTETLLAGFDLWGVDETIRKTVGMFAFAVFDRKNRCMFLARDRVGEKPLYYGLQGTGRKKTFLFGSELSSLRQHPVFKARVDCGSLALFSRYGYVPGPYSIFENIFKLEAGHYLKIPLDNLDPVSVCYWDVAQIARDGLKNPITCSFTEAVDRLETLLKNSVRDQMVSDVPLGAFLSGGIDSSTVVALMQCQSHRRIKTFSIGFEEDSFNEARFARSVSHHLGTDHSELYVSAKDALGVIPSLPTMFSEPFADSSQIPTFLVSKLARTEVKVSLSGDGGDEVFCGYTRYTATNNLWNKLRIMPNSLKAAIGFSITSFSPRTLNSILTPLQGCLPYSLRGSNIGDKLHKGSAVLASSSVDELYRSLVSHCSPSEILLKSAEKPIVLDRVAEDFSDFDPISRMMILDTLSYMPDDILVKVDRATMSTSLEGRSPFLDHRVVEFAWSLPENFKLRNGKGKYILRELLNRHVPQHLVERPKMGFGLPINEWLRGPLKEWAATLLDCKKIDQAGYFNSSEVDKKWKEHLSGDRNWSGFLWNILMFQSWSEESRL